MRSQSLPRAIERHTLSMKQLLLLASLLGTLLSSSLVTKLHINEHGTAYDEDIEYDPETEAMKLTVPAHNDIQGQTVIIHAKKSLSYDPVANDCTLVPLSDDFDPKSFFDYSLRTQINNETVSVNNATTRYFSKLDKGLVSEAERSQLLPSMQQLCKDVPIRQMVQVEVSKESFFSNERFVVDVEDDHSSPAAGHRVKRWGQICNNMAYSCEKRCPGCRKCQWLSVIINAKGTPKHELEHRLDNTLSCAACCHDYRLNNMCKCTEISSLSTFKSCQRLNG